MKRKSTVILAAVCAILLVVGSVMGTMAYLTSTDKVENTFTVGDVQIKLDEADVDEYGKKVSEDRVKANDYKLLPGHTYIKDPTVTVIKNSEESYIRMLVTVTNINEIDNLFAPEGADMTEIFKGYDAASWKYNGYKDNTTNNERTFEFRYKTTVNTLDGADLPLEPLFASITVPSVLNNAQLKTFAGMKISVEAQAIQADGFADANAAWGSLYA